MQGYLRLYVQKDCIICSAMDEPTARFIVTKIIQGNVSLMEPYGVFETAGNVQVWFVKQKNGVAEFSAV